MLSSQTTCQVTAVLLSSLLIPSAYGQEIFDENSNFICDPIHGLDCNYGDNIICDTDSLCTVECNDNCNGLVINAKMANSLSITNCINCDNMIIKCPQNRYGIDNHCNLEIANNVNNLIIYAQESFHDFNLIQSPYNDKNYDVYSSFMKCGDLNIHEFQCTLNYYGNACTNTQSLCQNYRLSPTTTTTTTSAPSIISTVAIYDGDGNSADLETTNETEPNGDIYVVEDVDYNQNQNEVSDEDGTLGLFTGTNGQNLTYALLIIGLCIIWGSFFCCFIITHHHREKKRQQLDRAVAAMSMSMARAMSRETSNLPSSNRSDIKVNIHDDDIKQNGIDSQLTQKPYLDPKFSLTSSTKSKKIRLQPPVCNMTNELYKVVSLSAMNEEEKKKDDVEETVMEEVEEEKEAMVCESIPVSPETINLRAQSLRPYFCDKLSPSSIYNMNQSQKMHNLPVLDPENQHSNPVSINTIEAVKIKLPSFHDKDDKLKIDRYHQRNHLSVDGVDCKDEEEGLSFYKGSVETVNQVEEEEEVKEEQDESMDIPLELQYKLHLHLQSEGGSTPIQSEMTEITEMPPPPPPPSLVHDNDHHEIHGALHGVNALSKCSGIIGHNPPKIEILSPSQHYRVKYSIGIQQDIQNCMSVPGAAADKKFGFDEEEEEDLESDKSQSIPQHCLLKPPLIPVDSLVGNQPHIMYNNV